MKVVKKINNNVVVCLDNNGEELVAFGKGLGFEKIPYELIDLNRISMTFYKLNYQYYQLLKEIPANIFATSTEIVKKAQNIIPRSLNPNLVFSLADHINFAIARLSSYQDMQLPFSYDIEQLYPQETKVGYYAIELIKHRLKVRLPTSEATAIAMHFVNSQTIDVSAIDQIQTDDGLIEQAMKIIEQEFDIQINRKEFMYNRFAMHLRYYIKRIKNKKQLSENDNITIFDSMKQEDPQIYVGAKRIADYIDTKLNTISTQDEVFYLMIYVKRIVNKEKNKLKEHQ
ncbi:PRD domain-containing protein [Liquorilactobacillus mali]|uniref:PRD domain-containing protein n=1 Tax=Liquorilactobacillus mali TaxID=1618 RepID=UPI00295419DD|nr:PRD domain-containing protein [Liquorilactobacillus mali]MDV7757529.1 PRD domain-containing protein [Liquorilactobacillus mali]